MSENQTRPGLNITDMEGAAVESVAGFLESAEYCIDQQFGAGHAAKHPALVAGFVQASALVYLAERLEGCQHG